MTHRCITAFAAIVTGSLCSNAHGEWHNALKPAGEPTGRFTVVMDGKSACVIQTPAQPTGPETKAADDLQHWIREMTGTTVAIASGEGSGGLILIRTDRSLGDEGYEIAIEKDRLILSGGKTRGTINAVYALLEEDLGCRFYTNESIRLPKSETLVIAPVARRYIPRLKVRDPFYACAFDAVWSLRNRTNAQSARVPEEYGGYVDYDGMYVHTAAQMVPPDKYFKDHPEYFAQAADGKHSTNQLCPTEPDVVKIVTEYVRNVLKEKPHTEIVSVSKNDNTEMCHCPRCVNLRDSEGSDMANQLFLVNQVAENIQKDYPEVVVDTLAYLETIQVPKTARPRQNVAIRLCNDAVGSWVHPFTPAERCDIAKLAGAWGGAHNRIYIWDYNVNFSHYLAPMPNIDVIAANIRFWIRNNAEGVMLQGGYQGPAEHDELKCWVASKILWDPSRDEKALTQDFIWGHYGKAAPPMAEYDALLYKSKADHAKEMESPAGGIRYPMDTPFLTKDVINRATELFLKAKELANGDEVLTRRIGRAELPVLYVKCVRGPEFVGPDYARVITEFERIARREKIQYLQEGGPDFEPKLASYKNRIPKPAAQPVPPRATLPGVRILRDLEYVRGGHERNRLDLYLPDEAVRAAPVVVWIHGGGWQGGNKAGCPQAVLRLTAIGYAVAPINYRFSQHAVFPAQIHDCKAAIRWLRANAEKYNLDADHIGAWGGSAGGHLAALLGTTAGFKEFEGSGGNENYSSRVQAVVEVAGPSDFLTAGPQDTRTRLLGGDPLTDRDKAVKASPMTYVSSAAAPFLIIHGDEDKRVPISQSEMLAQALKDAGVEVKLLIVKGAGHSGPGFHSPENMQRIESFLGKHLGRPESPEAPK